MKLLNKSEARASLSDYVDHVREETIVIMAQGKPVAALFSLQGVDAETLSLSTNPKFLALIEKSRKRDKREGGMSSEKVRRLFNLPRKKTPFRRAPV